MIVQYSVPDGQRFLPIALGPHVTMIHVGRHDGRYVYEPTYQWLRSPEEGLRFHRLMHEDDVYDGPLDLARFGQAVVGPLSDDQKWLVNLLSYHHTRPSGVASADASAEQVSMATPTHEPATLGSYAALSTDIEVSLLAELGQAVTRGAELVSHGQQSPTAEPAHDAHAALPVPLTAPHTPETAVASPFGAPNSSSFRSSSRQPAGTVIACAPHTVTDTLKEAAVSTSMVAAGLIGGAIAGEMAGGDLAVASLGPIAEPLGQALGRNVGRILGGATAATAIRCSSRRRSTSSVRFHFDIPIQDA